MLHAMYVCMCDTVFVVLCVSLQPRSCANFNPITNPGERFECPADSEYDPAADNKTSPDVAACCKVSEEANKLIHTATAAAAAAATELTLITLIFKTEAGQNAVLATKTAPLHSVQSHHNLIPALCAT